MAPIPVQRSHFIIELRLEGALKIQDSWRPRWVRIYPVLLFTLAYFLFARAGLLLATISESASPVWPASGLAVAVLSFWGLRFSPGIFVGAFIANALVGGAFWANVAIALGNMTEGIIGALIIQRLIARKDLFDVQSELAAVVLASLLAPLTSALLGPISLLISGAILEANFWPVALTWWVGDAVGILILTPFLRAAFQFQKKELPRSPQEFAKRLLWIAAGSGLSISIFFYPSGNTLRFLTFWPTSFGASLSE